MMDENAVLNSILDKLKQYNGNKTLLLVALLNQHSCLMYQNQIEKATDLYEEIYLLQCLICEDVLKNEGYSYDENTEGFPIWKLDKGRILNKRELFN